MSESQPGRARRVRSVTELLLSIVLALEAIVVFFVTLTVYGLDVLDPVTAFVSGAVLVVLLMATALLLRYPWGIWLGWALQVVLLASGALLPALYFVAAIFIAMWVYCFIRGRQIDRGRAAQQ
ncbi:uncharacterized protein DUF4233 [Glaciihabitans tibetensis]|uniref:Uncharacterized protein DUF4233 n=1 Tax=Glaciihabitans tibetensis TaxID=1266600 RepID=A0A2T0VIS0_9MICO|nr:DUF4233 domain-containing protein [Glaciihabitans tibetensis]PRY70130.1 uncharacterized protein DUF4233 [Glaciihabitans tibetensis]